MAKKSVDNPKDKVSEGNASNQSRNRRLLSLKKVFEEHTDADHGITMVQILEHLKAYGVQANRSTVYEDIHLLRDLEKMDIEHGEGERFYKLKSRRFSVAELKLIVDSMASSKVLTPEATGELANKLAELCSRHEREYLKKKVFIDTRIKSENKRIPLYIKTLNEAIIHQRWVAFRYFSYDINKKKVYYYGGKNRRVRPAAMVTINDFYYLLGYDRRDRGKLYRIDRMSHVNIHSEKFGDLPEKVETKMARIAFAPGNPFKLLRTESAVVKLKCSNNAVDDILDKFGFSVQMIPEGKSHFTVSVNIEPTDDFYAWVFSLGGRVEILEPDLVRTSMAFKLTMASMRYDR